MYDERAMGEGGPLNDLGSEITYGGLISLTRGRLVKLSASLCSWRLRARNKRKTTSARSARTATPAETATATITLADRPEVLVSAPEEELGEAGFPALGDTVEVPDDGGGEGEDSWVVESEDESEDEGDGAGLVEDDVDGSADESVDNIVDEPIEEVAEGLVDSEPDGIPDAGGEVEDSPPVLSVDGGVAVD